MLKREDLEYLAGVLEKLGEGDCPIPEHFSEDAMVKLGGASPVLALACLHLREYVLGVYDGDFPRTADTGNALRIIDAALAAAGVEAES